MELNDEFKNLPWKTGINIMELCRTFEGHDYECVMVGGAVRDLIMGKKPHDFDFATNAPVEEMQKMFKKTIPTGIEHGTITIRINNQLFEVTRYRKDVATDGRRATVEFSDTIEEDLARRDFTCNAIAFNPLSGKTVDPYNGTQDIMDALLKFVGEPTDRILEDHLRALRMVRFCVGPNRMYIEPDDKILVENVFDETILSQERINDEANKIFERLKESHSEDQKAFVYGSFIGLNLFTRFLGDDWDWAQAIDQSVAAMNLFPIAWLMEQKHVSLDELKCEKNTKQLVQLVNKLSKIPVPTKKTTKQLMKFIFDETHSTEIFDKTFEAVMWLTIVKDLNMFEWHECFAEIVRIEKSGEPYLISHLKVKGEDVINEGYEGKEVGEILNYILKHIWEDPTYNQFTLLNRYDKAG